MSKSETDPVVYGGLIGYPSVLLAAESLGVENLDVKAAELLAEDLSYQLRNIIHKAVVIGNHKRKRVKLTTSAINWALETTNFQPVFGHDTTDEPEFVRCEDAKVFCLDEGTVDLVAMATCANIFLSSSSSSKLNCYEVSALPEDKPIQQPDDKMMESMMGYMEAVVDATLNGGDKFEKVLIDVRNHSKIDSVVPMLVEFIASVIEKGENSDWIINVFQLARNLISNNNIDVLALSVVEKLKSIVFMCALKPGFVRTKFLTGVADPFTLQNSAVDACAVLINKLQSVSPDLAGKEISDLFDLLKDSSHVFSSYAGALKVLGRVDLQEIDRRRSFALDLLTLHASWFPEIFDSQILKTVECVEYVGAWKSFLRRLYRNYLLKFYSHLYPERFCLNAGFIATPKLSGNETDEQKRLDEVIETLNCLQDATHNFFGTQIQPLLSFDVIRKADVNAKLEEPEITIIPSGEELLEMITSDDQPTTEIVPVTSEFEGSGSSHSQPPAKKRRRIKKKASDLFDVPRRFRLLHQRDLVLVFHATEAKVRIIEHPIPPILEKGEFHRCCARKAVDKLLPMQSRKSTTGGEASRLNFQRKTHFHRGPHSIADLIL